MTYEAFKDEFLEKFVSYLPKELEVTSVDIAPQEKVNQILDRICLNSQQTRNITPTLYMNDLYENYKECEDMDYVLQYAANKICKAIKEAPEVSFDPEQIKSNIVFQLINTEQNKELLLKVPHREFLDLSIIYRWLVDINEENTASALLTNDLATHIKITESALYELAMKNTKRLLSPTIIPIMEIIQELCGELDGLEPLDNLPVEKLMWVIGNEKKHNGAATILYEELLFELAEKLDSDLYLLPSSIHEWIAISSNEGNPSGLADMVRSINFEHVDISDRLSNQVYYYDRKQRVVKLVTDEPSSLDNPT